MDWAGHVARRRDRRVAYRVLMERSDKMRPIGRPRLRWEDNIKMDFQDVQWGDMNWIDLDHSIRDGRLL
jgi:hypothetical protein